MAMTPELSAAIENAYRVFGRYSLGGSIVVCNCTCCVHPDSEQLLIKTPLREISCALLAEYTNSAHGFDDQKIQNDFRYLLPRYFELIAQGELPTSSYEEVLLRRLGDACYTAAWPADEAAAVNRYFGCLFDDQVNTPIRLCDCHNRINTHGVDIEQTLLIIANGGADLRPLLAAWEQLTSRTATLHIATVASEIEVLVPKTFEDWDFRTETGYRALFDWVTTWENRQRVEDACLAETDPLAAQLLSIAEQNIAAVAARRDRNG